MSYPVRMNKLDITVKILDTEETKFDTVFRQPKPGQKKYLDEVTIKEIAQFKSKKFKKFDFSDSDNNGLETNARIVISSDDWDYMKNSLNIELKQGDIVTKIGSLSVKLRINEIRPTGFLRGKHNLYFLELVDFTVPLGGVK